MPRFQFLQKLRVIIQQPQEIHHRRHGGRIAPLVTGEGIPATTRDFCGLGLGKPQLPADTPDIFPLSGTDHVDKVIMRLGVSFATVLVQFSFTTRRAEPARKTR